MYKRPATPDEAPVRDRALTQTSKDGGIQAKTAVVGDEEAIQIFGIDLAREEIQAVWLEIRNNTGKSLALLSTAIDPDYYTPREVAFAYHKWFADDANAALDGHLLSLNFPITDLIKPQSSASGYIFTTWSQGIKVIDVDLVGDGFSQNFTFFASGPGTREAQDAMARVEKRYSHTELLDVKNENALRQALIQLPCCVSNQPNGTPAEPLNVVIIGALDDLITAMTRRGYRYQKHSPRYVFGRVQDFAGHKLSRGFIQAQTHSIRFWQTPIQFEGKTIWVGQTSNLRGGRFAADASAEGVQSIDPRVDEARYDLAQDLAYSQALIKLGYVKGAKRSGKLQAIESPADPHYVTDGLRVVLVLGDRPASLSTIDFFDWERLADYVSESNFMEVPK